MILQRQLSYSELLCTSSCILECIILQTHIVSFQCSRHATPDGIVKVFKLCASYQKDRDLDTFASVVVLDEVGLAEDSENMPLKVGTAMYRT